MEADAGKTGYAPGDRDRARPELVQHLDEEPSVWLPKVAMGCALGVPPPPQMPYPSHVRPVCMHLWHAGRLSSHLTFRILAQGTA
jgi:hypothetical protein